MLASKLVERVNILADEQEPEANIIEYMNDAIARMNIRLKANLPYLEGPDSEPIFPEKWQRTLLIPFALGRIKQQDASQFEYTDAYGEFEATLSDMSVQYVVPEEYSDVALDTGEGIPIMYENRPYGWSW